MELRTTVLIILTILFLSSMPIPSNADTVQATGFNVTDARWGTSASAVEAGPGQQNTPLTVTLNYYFQNTASSVQATLSLPSGFTDTNGGSSPVAYISGYVGSGTVFSLTFNLNIGAGVTTGTYNFPLMITWAAITNQATLTSVNLIQYTSVTVQLRGKVQLQFSASQPSVIPGTVTHVPIAVSNIGTGAASNVSLTVSASSSSLSAPTIIILNAPGKIAQVTANSSAVSFVDVYAPSTSAGSLATLLVTATYSDAYGNERSTTGTIGVYVSSVVVTPIRITATSLLLTPGDINNATLVISNSGQQSVTNLQLGVTVPSSISVLGEYPVLLAELRAGSREQTGLPLFVSSALAGSPVTITVTVTFTDAAGSVGMVTQNLGFYVPIAQSANLGLSGYSYNPPLIYPGVTVASLRVSLVNSGTTTASNVNVTLIPSSPVYAISKGSLSNHLGLLSSGQSVSLTFMIGILNSTAPLNSTLALSVQYSGGKPLEFSIPFTEQPKANFQIVSVSAPQIAAGDGADQVTIAVRNTGNATARFSTFTTQPSNAFQPSSQGTFTSSTSVAAGTLSPGESANLTVVIQVNSNIRSGSYPLILNAGWTQLGTTQPFDQQIKVVLLVHDSIFQILNDILLSAPFLAAIVIVILAVIALRVRKRVRQKRE